MKLLNEYEMYKRIKEKLNKTIILYIPGVQKLNLFPKE